MSGAAAGSVQTTRLIGERPSQAHAVELHALLGDPRVNAWLRPPPLPGPPDLAEVRAMLARDADEWQALGFSTWIFRERASGELVGRGGLRRLPIAGRDEVEVGWAVRPDRWGRGLATEIGGAGLQLAFGALGLETVVSLTIPANARSRRVMEKLGLRERGAVLHAGLPHVLYRIAAPDYETTVRPPGSIA